MNTKLNHLEDWAVLAKEAKWSVKEMANLCNVTARALQLHFGRAMGKSPKKWITEPRMHLARQYLRKGLSVKETARKLNYGSEYHFSREFKRYWGFGPTQAVQTDGKLRISA